MKLLFAVVLIIEMSSVFGQKFMVKDNDTLPYKETMEIHKDTLRFGSNVFYPGDTSYSAPCATFEKINGQIINVTDDRCLRQGLWIINDSIGNYWEGRYHNNNQTGLWGQYGKNGRILKEIENVSFANETYLVKDIDYSSGVPVVKINKPFLSFYIKNLVMIFILLMVSFWSRVFINSSIWNDENNTDFSPIYFFFPGFVSKNYFHSLLCVFTFWFSDYKPENRQLVIISNTLSVIALTIFFGTIIGFAISGEIH